MSTRAESALDVVDGPRLETLAETAALGIREVVPFRTMLAHRDRLLAELVDWLRERTLEPTGPFFLRLHVVDMGGDMDIEVGVVCEGEGDHRVRAGVLPAGEHAVLAYRTHSLAANRTLLGWIASRGREPAMASIAAGDAFVGRTEYLTDPRTEPRKKKWVVQLTFLLREESIR